MANNEFSWRTLTRASVLMVPPTSLLTTLVFQSRITYPTDAIELHELEYSQLIMQEALPNGEASILGGDARTQKVVVPPVYKQKTPMTAKDLATRSIGASLFVASASDIEAAKQQEANDVLKAQLNAKERRLEAMASSVLQDSLTFTNYATITTGVPSSHKVAMSSGSSWTSGRTILSDIRTYSDTIAKDSGAYPDIAIMGTTAWNLMMADSATQSQLDNRSMSIASIAPGRPIGAAKFRGTIEGIEMWTHEGQYVSSIGGSATRMFPADAFIMISRQAAGAELWFGANYDFDSDGNPLVIQGEQYVKQYRHASESQPVRFTEMWCRPLPVVRFPKAITIFTNVDA